MLELPGNGLPDAEGFVGLHPACEFRIALLLHAAEPVDDHGHGRGRRIAVRAGDLRYQEALPVGTGDIAPEGRIARVNGRAQLEQRLR